MARNQPEGFAVLVIPLEADDRRSGRSLEPSDAGCTEHGRSDREETRLLVRRVQHHDESSVGFNMRVAAENGLSDPRWLAGPPVARPHGRWKLCSLCLKEPKGYWRTGWNGGEWPVCHKHAVWLRSSCSGCGEPIGRNSARFKNCRCGSEYGSQPVDAVSSELLHVMAAGTTSRQVLSWLGSISLFGPAGKPLKAASRDAVDSQRPVLTMGAQIVSAWPDLFLSSLVEHMRAGREAAPSTARFEQLMPGLLVQVRRLGDADWRARVVSALRQLVAGGHHAAPPTLSRSPHLLGSSLTARDAARQLNVRPERVAVIAEVAMLTVQQGISRAGRRRLALSSVDVERMRLALGDQISRSAAARLVGIGRQRLELLSAAGQLAVKGDLYSRVNLEAWSDELRARAQTAAAGLCGMVTVEWALRCLVPRDLTVLFFADLGVARTLPACARSPDQRVGDLTVERAQVSAWLQTKAEARVGMYTVNEAALILKLKQQVVYDLVDRGLLESTATTVRGRLARMVDQAALLRFTKTYRPLVNIAREHGVAPKGAFDWGTQRHLDIATGPRIDGARQYFVRLSAKSSIATV